MNYIFSFVRVVWLDLQEFTIKNVKLNLQLPEIQLHVHQWAPLLFGMYNVTNVYSWWWWHQRPWKCSSALKHRLEDGLVLNPNASCTLWAFFFFFFTGCNRCLSSAARSLANSGILIIALATATGLVAVESEPVSDWLPRRTAQSTEFHLMKGSVQQAAARGCSLRVGDPAVCHFSLSISVRARLWNTQIRLITPINSSFCGKNTGRACVLNRKSNPPSTAHHETLHFDLISLLWL